MVYLLRGSIHFITLLFISKLTNFFFMPGLFIAGVYLFISSTLLTNGSEHEWYVITHYVKGVEPCVRRRRRLAAILGRSRKFSNNNKWLGDNRWQCAKSRTEGGKSLNKYPNLCEFECFPQIICLFERCHCGYRWYEFEYTVISSTLNANIAAS